jgi:hypothetical protein
MKAPRLLAASLLVAAAAQAQTIYRCGPDGREYSHQPCKQGREVDVGPPPTAEQRAQAKRAADGDARRAEALRRERHARERAAQPAAGFTPAPAEAASAPPKKKPPAKPKKPTSAPAR